MAIKYYCDIEACKREVESDKLVDVFAMKTDDSLAGTNRKKPYMQPLQICVHCAVWLRDAINLLPRMEKGLSLDKA